MVALEIMLSQSFLLLLLPLLTHPLSNSNFTISLWQVSMALIRAVPPFTDWASILAPMSKSIFTISSWGRGGWRVRRRRRRGDPYILTSVCTV